MNWTDVGGTFLLVLAMGSLVDNLKDLEPGIKNIGWRLFAMLWALGLTAGGLRMLGVIGA